MSTDPTAAVRGLPEYQRLRTTDGALRQIVGHYQLAAQRFRGQPAHLAALREAAIGEFRHLDARIAADRAAVLAAISSRLQPRGATPYADPASALLRELRDERIWARLARELEAGAAPGELVAAAGPDELAVLLAELPSYLRARGETEAYAGLAALAEARVAELRPELGPLLALRAEVQRGGEALGMGARFAAYDLEHDHATTTLAAYDGTAETVPLQPAPAAPTPAEMAAQLAGGS